MRVVRMHISTQVTCSNVGSEYAICIWGYLHNKTLFGARCIVFRLGIIGMMKRILGSMIRIYNYHHSTKLYRKISRVCCRLYCYECAARVTMPTATNE